LRSTTCSASRRIVQRARPAGGFEQPIEIQAAVRIHGDELTVDFAGSSGPVPLGVNVALNYTRAYTTYGIKCVISPDVPR
jgi:N-methylhydantoinase B